jgi:shikimate kinase
MRNNAADRRNVALVGPMGSGKSHVGRLLAARLGLSFVDLDARIADAAGVPIPAIFASEGEAGFRVRESAALADALARAGQVIATGGGAVLATGNRAALRAAATVIYLQVALDEQLRRLAGDGGRPLLQGVDPAERLAQLQQQREPLYRAVAALVFDTGTLPPEQVADALAGWLTGQEEASA